MRPIIIFLNFFLMLSLPFVLGWFIARRRQVSWRFFGIGAVTFVLSQVAHIPFNYLVSPGISEQVAQLPEMTALLLSAAFLGLSAGIFEEGARYLAYRYWAKDARSWSRGLMLGAGHGGAESILLGLLGAFNASILLGYNAGYFQNLIPSEQAPQVQAVLDQMFSIPWFEAMFGALERSFVLVIQMALSLMVMQVFTRGKVKWLILAIGWHALIDGAVVVTVSLYGIYAAEAVTALAMLISLATIYKLKGPEPETAVLEPLPEAGLARPIAIEPTQDKLEESRYL
jgi:uncharacterized membrane protein YhfC